MKYLLLLFLLGCEQIPNTLFDSHGVDTKCIRVDRLGDLCKHTNIRGDSVCILEDGVYKLAIIDCKFYDGL